MSQPKNIPEGQSPNASSKASNGAKQRHIFRKIIAIIIALGMIALGVYFMLGCTSAQKEQTTPTEEAETEDGDYKHATAFKLTNRDKTFETLYRYYGAQIRAVKE